MAIGTDSAIIFFGTQDEVTSGTPATISDGAYGLSDQGATVNWTNADDAPLGAAVLKLQFDTTAPTVGTVSLYARLFNLQSTNNAGAPDANYETLFVGSFPLDYGVAADVDYFTYIETFSMPAIETAQRIDWYLKNEGTGQTIGVSWQLWITPKTEGPHA